MHSTAKSPPSEKDWGRVWEETLPRWDYLCQIIYEVLVKECGGMAGKTVLEAGSGSGRISLAAARDGAQVRLLDYSRQAIRLSRTYFALAQKPVLTTAGSIFQLPFRSASYDVVWNAGLIEHYEPWEQKMALREMSRVVRPHGLVITVNPFAGSILHNVGKYVIESVATYPYGREIPIRTLIPMQEQMGCRLIKPEYSVGFLCLFVGVFKRLALLPRGKSVFNRIFLTLSHAFCALHQSRLGPTVIRIDRWLSRVFGGYVLVSVFEREHHRC